MVGKEGRGPRLQSHRLLQQPEKICVCMQDVSDICYDVLCDFKQNHLHVQVPLTVHQHHAGTLNFPTRVFSPALILALVLRQGLGNGQGALSACRGSQDRNSQHRHMVNTETPNMTTKTVSTGTWSTKRANMTKETVRPESDSADTPSIGLYVSPVNIVVRWSAQGWSAQRWSIK